MAYYMSIRADQRPFTIGEDDNFRTMWSCNFTAQSFGDVNTWEQDIASVITTAALATFGVDLFIGPRSITPDGDGPFTTIIDTGGAREDLAHCDPNVMENLSAQVMIRDRNFQSGQILALAVWRALRIHNTLI